MMPGIACLLVGMLLGQRFKVLVLAPAIALIIALSIVFGVARADALWSVAAMAMVATANLQMGYLAGIALRAFLVGICPNPVDATLMTPAPTRRPAL
jgi:hypothetical protein